MALELKPVLKKISRVLPDSIYIRSLYKRISGKKLNLSNPKTFNEKLQWLKIHDRKPTYSAMVDKYEAKEYVKNIIGEEYIIPTIGVWDKFGDIDFDKLPNQFVLKCTHDSGGLVICRDKENFDLSSGKSKLRGSSKRFIIGIVVIGHIRMTNHVLSLRNIWKTQILTIRNQTNTSFGVLMEFQGLFPLFFSHMVTI